MTAPSSTLTEMPVRRLLGPVLLLAAAWLSADFLGTAYLKYHGAAPDSLGLFVGRHGWLLTHLAGGALTIVIGPLQLLRHRVPAVRPAHRWTGRLYLLGMLIGCVGASGLIVTSPAPAGIRLAFAATLFAWVGTAAVAMVAIRSQRLPTHRLWMTRNYLVTLAPVSFRLLLPLAIALGWAPTPSLIASLLWASWTLPLLVLELLRQVPAFGLFGGPPSRPPSRLGA